MPPRSAFCVDVEYHTWISSLYHWRSNHLSPIVSFNHQQRVSLKYSKATRINCHVKTLEYIHFCHTPVSILLMFFEISGIWTLKLSNVPQLYKQISSIFTCYSLSSITAPCIQCLIWFMHQVYYFLSMQISSWTSYISRMDVCVWLTPEN